MNVPIPVGHRVEVTFYRRPKRSTWDGRVVAYDGERTREEAVVRDLETGILHGKHWHFCEDIRAADYDPEPPAGYVVDARFTARVVACQIVHLEGELSAETVLLLEPAPESGPFR